MHILSINISKPIKLTRGPKTMTTGICKQPIAGDQKIWIRKLNVEGDGQGDLKHHGGVHKAVYAYGTDAFVWWKQNWPNPISPGEFGENLTLSELDESALCVGDVIQSGDCQLQVSEPRFPCATLAFRFDDPAIVKTFMQSKRPGIYFRVLQEGQIQTGDKFTVVERDPQKVPLLELFKMKLPGQMNKDALKRALNVKSLTDEWKDRIQRYVSSNG